MAVPISSWAQQVAMGINVACAALIAYMTQTSDFDTDGLWHNVAPIFAMQLVISALSMMNGSKIIPGIALLVSIGCVGWELWGIYS